MNDKQLRQDILDELDFDPRLDSTKIGITVRGGVVTLSGHVSSYAEKIAAERATWRVKGVKAIAQELEVRFASDAKLSDDDIAKRALDILKWDTSVPHDAIKVSVQKGWVTLAGEVDWQFQRLAAENDVRKLSGVIGINNSIAIKSGLRVADIKSKIEDALRRHAEVEARSIRISVLDGGAVKLEGTVDNWEERRAVEQAAWSVAGVQKVDDDITIG